MHRGAGAFEFAMLRMIADLSIGTAVRLEALTVSGGSCCGQTFHSLLMSQHVDQEEYRNMRSDASRNLQIFVE